MNESSQKSLQQLKTSIVDVVSRKLNIKLELPSSWALLEYFLREKEDPVLSIEEVNKINLERPKEYRLGKASEDAQKEISDFLSFLHSHGLVLYFNEEKLKTHVILRMQWFADAFSKLITDKPEECSTIYIDEWESFDKTGELKNELVDALWKEEQYSKHKIELLSYMARLKMVVNVESLRKDISWYVPCMNKKPFHQSILKDNWECTSILSFRLNSFALFEYYRLVADCMSKWTVETDKDSLCLYHTAAMFEHKNHTVLVGIYGNDIQVQVRRIKDLNPMVSREIGECVENALDELTKTFNEGKTYQKGYKCLNIFCNDEDQTFIPASKLTDTTDNTFQCDCQIKEKHAIDVQKTTRYWEQTTRLRLSESSSSSEKSTEQGAGGGGGGEKFCKPVEGGYKYKVGDIIHKNNLKDSIGCIRVKSGGREVPGTGFRVGERHVLTAYHVVQEVFENLWGRVNKKIKQQSTDDTPGDGKWSLTDLAIRLELDSNTRELFKTIGKRMVSDVCTITFGYVDDKNGTTFSFSYDAPFISTKHDVAILELLTEESNNFIPHPLSLAAVYTSIGHLFVLGHPAGGELIIDPMCQILSDEELGRSIKKGIKLFTSLDEAHSDVEKDYSKCKISQNEVFFHCSKSTTHGASGSPLIQIPKDEKPEVIGVLLTGYPKLYYNKYQNKDVDIHPDVLIESGVSMEMVKKLLDEHGLKELADALFRECK